MNSKLVWGIFVICAEFTPMENSGEGGALEY